SYANRWRTAITDSRNFAATLGGLVLPPGGDPPLTEVYLHLAREYGWQEPTQAEIDDFNLFVGEITAAIDMVPSALGRLINVGIAAAQVTTLLQDIFPTTRTVDDLIRTLQFLGSQSDLILHFPALVHDTVMALQATLAAHIHAVSLPL